MEAEGTGARARARGGDGGAALRRGWQVPLRYALFQLPESLAVAAVLALLVRLDWIAPRSAVSVGLLWLVKEVALYPLTRDAYRGGQVDPQRLVGRRGVARRRLAPRGWVFVAGALWRAEAADAGNPPEAGDEVEVVAVRGNRLTVAAVRRREEP